MSNLKITSKKVFFDITLTHAVRRTVIGGLTLDEWDDFVENAKKSFISQGISESDIEETEKKLSIKSTGQFWLRPKTPRVMTGKIVVRSNDFYFESDQFDTGLAKSYCEKSKVILDNGELELTALNGSKIRYSIID